jgi:hypothetical protein
LRHTARSYPRDGMPLCGRPPFGSAPTPRRKPRRAPARSASGARTRRAPAAGAPRRRAAQGAPAAPPPKAKVVGCGSSGVDYLAAVAAYPRPDQKLRTESLQARARWSKNAARARGLAPAVWASA